MSRSLLQIGVAWSILFAAGCGGRSSAFLLDSGDHQDAQPGVDSRLDDQGFRPYSGRVFLTEARDQRINSPPSVVAQVGFVQGSFYDTGISYSQTFGDCRLGTLAPPPPGLPTFIDGGRVTITGGDRPMSFTFKQNDYYTSNLGKGIYSLFSNGQTLTISGGGSTLIPTPFSATLKAPATLSVIEPKLDQQSTVSLAKDWTVRWIQGAASRVRVTLSCPQGSAQVLVCDSADDGQVLVQAAALKAQAAACKQPDVDVERIGERTITSPHVAFTARAVIDERGGVVLQ